MDYTRELEYMKKILRKQRISVHILNALNITETELDFGLRHIAGRELLDMSVFVRNFGDVRHRVIYKIRDIFRCSYLMLLLPDRETDILMIGPYTDIPMTEELIMESAAQLSVLPRRIKELVECYANIPAVEDEGYLLSIFYSFGEHIWGGSKAYEVMDLNEVLTEQQTPIKAEQLEGHGKDLKVAMHLMEKRYEWENELMLTVSRGQSNRAEMMLSDMAELSFRRRLSDPVRNMKNYCIICNTLMRKAAQQGGVHPMYLDTVSSDYAAKIESQTNVEAVSGLIVEMIHNYCRLVKKYSTRDYSPLIRRAIILIDSQLSEELGLKHIASALETNPSYLSNLFKKETGSTITAYITKRRMEQAGNLLRNTAMQVQNVATYCGIPDANYFSKLFKKHTGMNPMEYRSQPPIDL